MLQCESQAGRPDERTAGRDDGPDAARDPRLVPEQTVQGQKENGSDETPNPAGEGKYLLNQSMIYLVTCIVTTKRVLDTCDNL